MQSLRVTLFGHKGTELHDCQCCYERHEKKKATEANAEANQNANMLTYMGLRLKR